jgi:hypothetical protein
MRTSAESKDLLLSFGTLVHPTTLSSIAARVGSLTLFEGQINRVVDRKFRREQGVLTP